MTSVLVVGSGAREHALLWKLAQSPDVDTLYVTPGNAGTRFLGENGSLSVTDLDGIVRFAEERNIDLTVIGPEAPLALGLADRLRARGRPVVGPNASAARIEWSKVFAKDLMRRAGVPMARYAAFHEPGMAFRHVRDCSYPIVIKADGLAGGKGVVICEDVRAARAVVEAMMVDRIHGEAGNHVVIEEMLRGPEVSLLAFVDGTRAVPLAVAQDHKRLLDGDAGPNTGGMGAYSPVPFVDSETEMRLTVQFIEPIVQALSDLGTPYRGILFAGLMLTQDGPRVLEYNCRLGDPEAQVVLPLLAEDLLPWLQAVAEGDLSGTGPAKHGAALGVVLAVPGYPEEPRPGARIEGIDDLPDDVLAFHARTSLDSEGRPVTAGGRVMTLVGLGKTVDEAAEKAYSAQVRFDGMQRRSDIGWQARIPQGAVVGQPSNVIRQRARIAVLASGDGSNLQAVVDACAIGSLTADVVVVVSHRPGARALKRARNAGIPTCIVILQERRDAHARHIFEEEVLAALAPYSLDLIVLAGWMLILSADFLDRCGCPVLNVHPALLHPLAVSEVRNLHLERYLQAAGVSSGAIPQKFGGESLQGGSFPILRGVHAVRDAIELQLPWTGVSVHLVTPDVDAGPVVLAEAIEIGQGDDERSLYDRIKTVEHRLLPQAIQTILSRF